jgi:hypothetical protein
VREPVPVDPLRESVTDLVPHVRDSVLGDGWVWEPIQDDPIDLGGDGDGKGPRGD